MLVESRHPQRPAEISMLRQSGLRCTPQRLAIVHELFSRSHPTAAEVYEAVRSQYPTIGLQTIYNTLWALTERGLVTELPFSSAIRFDSNVLPHANLVCRGCGDIQDVEFAREQLDSLLLHVSQPTGFAPDGQRLDVYGLCQACQKSP
jgi:Fur family peroxide stress response transcriptional regulator